MTTHEMTLLLVGPAVVILAARMAGALAVKLRQPPVVGEIVLGVLMGPTLLNGALGDALFPPSLTPFLTGLSSIAVAMFMFHAGLEMDVRTLRGSGRLTAVVAAGSALAPFALGVGLGLALSAQDEAQRGGQGGTLFAVFLGLSLSVTAFPVLARIIDDRGLAGTTTGGIALAAAAVVDVVAWVALAVVVSLVSGGTRWEVALVVPYVLVMLGVVRPLLRRAARRTTDGTVAAWAAVLPAAALLSAAATEAMGLHLIFGAFVCGLVVPRAPADGPGSADASTVGAVHAFVTPRVGQVASLFLPLFFVLGGRQVDLRLLDGSAWRLLVLVLVVAVVGKLGGTYVAARSQGCAPRASATLAALMNTRGLTEIVLLTVGLEIGLIDTGMYSLLVVMAVVTTAMTGPLLTLVDRTRPGGPPPADGTPRDARVGADAQPDPVRI